MPDATWYWDKTENNTVLYSSALVSALNGMEGSQYSKEGVRSNVIVEIRYSWVNESYCGLHPSVLSITVLFAHFRMRGRPLKLFLLDRVPKRPRQVLVVCTDSSSHKNKSQGEIVDSTTRERPISRRRFFRIPRHHLDCVCLSVFVAIDSNLLWLTFPPDTHTKTTTTTGPITTIVLLFCGLLAPQDAFSSFFSSCSCSHFARDLVSVPIQAFSGP